MAIHDIIDASPTAAVISDPRQADNPIIACNDAFVRLTGYAREEIVGRNCRFLSGPDTEPALTEVLRSAIRKRHPAMVEILNYKKDGTPFRNAVMVAPIFDDAGELEYFLGSQMEVIGTSGLSSADRRSTAQGKIAGLTGRQREILEMLSSGKLNKQIAYVLGLSERTVKMHRAALLKALDVRTSADAIRLAVEAGF